MARKAAVNVEKEIRDADLQLWQLLVRNSDFQDDLYILRDKYFLFLDLVKAVKEGGEEMWGALGIQRFKEYWDKEKLLESQWGLVRIPRQAMFMAPDLYSDANVNDVKKMESCYEADIKNSPIDLPVVDAKWHRFPYFVNIKVNVTKPMYVVLASIQSELSKFYKNKPVNRNRPDNRDFELKVFDLVQYEHTDFKSAARKLGSPISTVRSAYLSISRKIAFVREFPTASESVLEKLVPKKKERTPDTYPGPIPQCPNVSTETGAPCRSAQKPEDFCSAHKAWAEQDERYLREYLPADLSAIDHARSRH